MLPSRFVLPPTQTDRALRLARFLALEDPLADAVIDDLAPRPQPEREALITQMLTRSDGVLPMSLATMREWLRAEPLWVDEAQTNAGGEVLLRNGLLAGLVLGFKSLVLGYCAPAGNKPLIFSGRLTGDVNRRLAETARFVEAVSHPNGLRFGAPGFIAAVRVRLIHARIRHALRNAPMWKANEWGAPINQYDMAGTVLLFSSMLLDGLRQLGVQITREEDDVVLHQWRVVGRLMGVDEELLSTTPREAASLWAMLEATQHAPDADSRKLTHALILDGAERGAPPAATDFGYALCRFLIGPRYADALSLPHSGWDLAPHLLEPLVRGVDRTLRGLPGLRQRALRLGVGYWRRVVELTFADREVPFTLPWHPLRDVERAS